MATQQIPRLLTVSEAAAAIGLKKWRLYSLLKKGAGPKFLRLGRTLRISEAELIRWTEESAVQQEEEE